MLIFDNPSDPELSYEVETTYDDRYLIMMVAKGTDANNLVYYADLTKPENRELKGRMTFTPLVDEWVGAFNYIQNDGTRFFFDTSYKAPRGKIVQIDLEKPNSADWHDVISQPEGNVVALKSHLISNYTLVITYEKDVSSEMAAWQLPTTENGLSVAQRIHDI